jgi:hypothetical protein
VKLGHFFMLFHVYVDKIVKKYAYLEGSHIMTLAKYAKKYKLSHSNLIYKANRQTIEAFLEKGIWKIGVSQDKK